MPGPILIVEETRTLGLHLAAELLARDGGTLFYLASPKDELSLAEQRGQICAAVRSASGTGGPGPEELEARLRMATADPRRDDLGLSDLLPEDLRLGEIWCLGAVSGAVATRTVLTLAEGRGAGEFNYVREAGLAGAGSGEVEARHLALESEVAERCRAHAIGWRIFRTGCLLDRGASSRGEGVSGFLLELHALKSEIEERLPEYFDYQALRCWAPPGATLNLVRVAEVAACLAQAGRRPETLGSCLRLASPESTPFADFCQRVGTAFGLSLLAVEDRGSLTAIDRLFEARLDGLEARRETPGASPAEAGSQAPDAAPAPAALGEEEQSAILGRLCRELDARRAARRDGAGRLFSSLAPRTVERGGSRLSYYVDGEGEVPIVLISALGFGLHYWCRLMDLLRRRHRVIIWEPRGTFDPPQPFLMQDQVDDLEAILRQESVASCHLIGWCSGAKVAIELCLRHPEQVRSIVFLNGTFKCLGSPEELDTAYERGFELLCHNLDRLPRLASSVLKTLRASPADDELDLHTETDPGKVAEHALSCMNVDLKPHAMAPFHNEASLLNYVRQLLDFWSYDPRDRAARVRVPVLFIAAEYDKVAAPAMSRTVAQSFPQAHLVAVPGATHYCLYDRPDLISGLVEDFLHRQGDAGREPAPPPAGS